MVNKVVQYLSDAKLELKKVVWPTKEQTTKNTLLVIGFSLALAFFLGAIDYLLNITLERII